MLKIGDRVYNKTRGCGTITAIAGKYRPYKVDFDNETFLRRWYDSTELIKINSVNKLKKLIRS